MTQAAQKAPPYFLYFPGNYHWSAPILSVLSSAASFYLRACKYYQMGERFRMPKHKLLRA